MTGSPVLLLLPGSAPGSLAGQVPLEPVDVVKVSALEVVQVL